MTTRTSITHEETTLATTDDGCVTEVIHIELAARDLLPDEHWLDAGYMSAEHILTMHEHYGVDLIGPVRTDTSWQARAGLGFDKASFEIDWQAKTVACPRGHPCQHWSETQDQRDTHTPKKTHLSEKQGRGVRIKNSCFWQAGYGSR